METVRERYDKRLELRYGRGMGWLGLVHKSGMGATGNLDALACVCKGCLIALV